jgi:cytochrome P450
MSFASGIHYCLGANLARAEAQEVFAGLIRRFSAIAPDGGPPLPPSPGAPWPRTLPSPR